MKELYIVIDDWGEKDLKEYLMSLNGVLDIIIKNDEQLEIYIKYNPGLITDKIIKKEILFFLNKLKTPSILAFNKHPNIKTSNYTIIRDDLCCEYCFKGAIEDLFEIEGIEKVESNFNEETLYNKNVQIIINIEYNPNIINIEKMKQIELMLNI